MNESIRSVEFCFCFWFIETYSGKDKAVSYAAGMFVVNKTTTTSNGGKIFPDKINKLEDGVLVITSD